MKKTVFCKPGDEPVRPEPDGPLPGLFSRRLLAWYGQNARLLPWRETGDPYRIWVSEVMLQQTRIETVIPYYSRFIAALPDARALAEASESALLKLWEGLGYYGRVRAMQKAARIVTDEYSGRLPASFEKLRELPGFGDYTAGAVASIAFGLPAAAVDGNALRVLARLYDCPDDISAPETKRKLGQRARRLLPEDRPGDFNQALMDLGSRICVPGAAVRCTRCPVPGFCLANLRGHASALPVKGPKRTRREEKRTLFALRCESGLLLRRRPDGGLLAGLWELPGAEGWLNPEEASAFLRRLGAVPENLCPLKPYRHVFSHLEWHIHGYRAYSDAFPLSGGFVWAGETEIETEYSIPGAFKPYVRAALGV